MSLEIERKFLVRKDVDIESLSRGRSVEILQGYLSRDVDATVRVRVSGDRAWLTVKSRNHGSVRNEWEYPIPADDARAMLNLPGVKVLSKTRHFVEVDSLTWEVDVFHGALEGLVLAEVELPGADMNIRLPDFVDTEVTDNPAYYNSVLIDSL